MRTRRNHPREVGTSVLTLSVATAVMVVGGAQAAQEASFDAPPMSISERLDMLERDNQLLREEVRTLRAEDADGWMTEARSAEIRALVSDVLEDSATRTSLQDGGALGGWSADRGFYLRADNRYRSSSTDSSRPATSEPDLRRRFPQHRQQRTFFPSSQQRLRFDLPHPLVFGVTSTSPVRVLPPTQFSPVQWGKPENRPSGR